MRQIILLADDSSTIQRLVTQTFADTRFDIVPVSNGDAALRRFEEIQPDIVLADIYMPGKNGFEVCAYIKAHGTLSGTPVILLVGAYDPFDESSATRAGAVAHITKPFEPRALVELVKSVLSESPKPAKARTPVHAEAGASAESGSTPMPMAPPAATPAVAAPVDSGDLLGLEALFRPEVVTAPVEVPARLSIEEIDKIADRVIHKLSSQIVEDIAWDVVPNIAVRILRDELKKTTHEG